MSAWVYKGREPTDAEVHDHVAFVYVITRKSDGKRYFGKKRLLKKVTKPPLKGKKRKRVTYSESDWRDYWGSNDDLQAEVTKDPEGFTREILQFCNTHGESSYLEAKLQFDHDVLLYPERFWNGWIQVKVSTSHVKGLRK
jgi:hypothetical protein